MPSDPPLPRGSLEFQRKQAKRLLRDVRAGDVEAGERAAEVLGGRAARRFVLADAQHVIAAEHGFRNWAEFRRSLASPGRSRPVARIGVADVEQYEQEAERLGAAFATGEAPAVRRVAAQLPHGAAAELLPRQARLVVARGYGYATWRELAADVRRFRAAWSAPPSAAMAEAIALIGTGDAEGLRALLARWPGLVHAQGPRAETLLNLVAQPDVFGEHLGAELGVDRACVEALIEAGADVDAPLNLAACFDRVELVTLLLEAGARCDAIDVWGITPLQTAIYHGAAAAADVLAAVAVVPDELWVAAGAGRVELLPGYLDGDGTPHSARVRPILADVGWPPGPPPTDDPDEILGEAFTLACHNGRAEAAAWLLDHNADADARPLYGITGLHFAAARGDRAMVRWLLDHDADPTLRDHLYDSTARGWAEHHGHYGLL